MKWEKMRTWRITFYIGNSVYDVEYYEAYKKPTKYADNNKGLATRFEIVEVEEECKRLSSLPVSPLVLASYQV